MSTTPAPTASVPYHINPQLKSLCVSLSLLKEDPKNARKHGKVNLESIKVSLLEHGQQKPIVVRKDGTIVAGNGFFRAAKALGGTELAVVQLDGDAKKARRFGIQDNRTAELSEWDLEMLGNLLDEEAASDDFIPESLGFTPQEYEKLSLADKVDDVDGEPPAETPAGSNSPMVPAGTVVPPDGAQPSHVRMVQLFMNQDNHPVFMEHIKKLSKALGTTTVTDTVIMAIRQAADALPDEAH